jgi:dihydrodipicolinate synthase/N-acetylneuraminate lyase
LPLELYAILPTPFAADGRAVDSGAVCRSIEWLLSHRISKFLLTGAYGEFPALSDEERLEVLAAARAVPGVTALMACAARPDTASTARLASRLLDGGADSVMVAVPLAGEYTRTEVLRHFESLAGAVSGPLVVYNNPAFGADLSAGELRQVVQLPPFVAVKQGTRCLRTLVESVAVCASVPGGRVRCLAASDLTAVAALAAGAGGLTSTNSCAFPEAVRSLVDCAGHGDFAAARRFAEALDPYLRLVAALGQPRTVKAAMQLRGLAVSDAVRLPYRPLNETERLALRQVLAEADERLAAIAATAPGPARGTPAGAPEATR